jgi:hypothetical protein
LSSEEAFSVLTSRYLSIADNAAMAINQTVKDQF